LPEKGSTKLDASKPILYFHYAGQTNTGMIRDHNEDAYKLPTDAEAGTLASKGHLYVLADGMGGHQKGEVASAVTIETVNSEYYTTVTPLESSDPVEAIVEALSTAIEKANNQVLNATEGGGTTVVAAVLYGDSLVAMNVGDSRAYLLRDNELRLLSKDHSLVRRLVEVGKITEEEALIHPRRNVLYQALGQGSDVDIHISSENLQVGDIVILCSDGLWGEVTEPELKDVLQAAPSPVAAAKQLIDAANASGGADNITAIIIQVSSEGPSRVSVDLDDTQPSLPLQRRATEPLPSRSQTDSSASLS
jgi:protein phosphatase